jgi:hypothetical protein
MKELILRILIAAITGGGSEAIRAMVRNEIRKELSKKVKTKLDEFEEELS